MRILLAPSSYHPNLGGIEHLTRTLAAEFRRQGHDPCVLTNRWPAELQVREFVDQIQVSRVDMPAPALRPSVLVTYPSRRRAAVRHIKSVMDERRVDVAVAVGASWQAVHVESAARRRRVPFVLNLQGETAMDDHRIYERSALLRSAFRGIVNRAAAVTGNSRWTLEQGARIAARAAGGAVIPNGVDFDELAALPPPPVDGPPTILAYGRLVRNKGFDLLLAAVERIEDVHLEIGGAGPEEAAIAARASALGERVRILGRLDRAGVRSALARSSVVVMPSRMEPFGIVALEGMAAGRPVVFSSIGGTAEFAAGGIGVDPNDTEGLAGAIRTALDHPEWGVAGREAARRLSWQRVAGLWADQLERLTG